MDECSLCSLSITRNIKIYQFNVIKRWWRYYPQWRSALCTSIKELFLQVFVASEPRIKRFVKVTRIQGNGISSFWGQVPNRTLWMRFTLLSKFDASRFSMTVVVYSQTGHFADFEKFKIDSHFADFGHVKIDLFVFTDFGQVTVILVSLGKKLDHKKQTEPSLTKNSRIKHRI